MAHLNENNAAQRVESALDHIREPEEQLLCVARLDEVDLAVVVNLETLREVLKSLSIDGKRWWIASDPRDAIGDGYISIGHGDPGCTDRLNTLHFRVPVVNGETPMGGTERLLLLFDESTSFPEERGFYLENSNVMEDPLEDMMRFFGPIKRALVDRLRAAD